MTPDLRRRLRALAEHSYDEHQMSAVLICWLCCKRECWAVWPMKGCATCR